MAEQKQFHAIGRRKSASARAFLTPGGSGEIVVNDRDLEDYFDRETTKRRADFPLRHLDVDDEFDIYCNTSGGGKSGQADAIQLAIARALVLVDPENRDELKEQGFLTRDDRVKERKKYGQRGARASFQFSKR
jgi:small subunit ribosomal protein S9